MSLIHWWPFSDTSYDQGINNAKTTVSNINYSLGKLGKAVNFINDNSYIKIDNLKELSALSEYSICCWVYLSSVATGHSSSFLSSGDWNSGSQQLCFAVYNFSNGAYRQLLFPNKDSWTRSIQLKTPILLNQWYHIAITYDGTKTKAYVNNILQGESSLGGISTTNVNYYYLGAATYYSGFTMHGQMNDFRIYNHALSQKEIHEVSKGLFAHYALNHLRFENSGSGNGVCTDGSGFGNTLINGPHPVLLSNDACLYDKSVIFKNDFQQHLSCPAFKFIKQNMTMSCWFKCNGAVQHSYQFIISQGRDCGNAGISIQLNQGGTTCYCRYKTLNMTNYTTCSFGSIELNKWYHAAVTYNGAQIKIYLNGVLKSTVNVTGDLDWAQCSDRFVIGKMAHAYDSTGSYFAFNGNVSDVRMYATALSDADIKQMYESKASIDKDGNYYIGMIEEKLDKKTTLSKLSIKKSHIFNEINNWIPIMYHNNKGGSNLFLSSNDFNHFVYNNKDCWANFQLMNSYTPSDGWYTFRAIQQLRNGEYRVYEWEQKINPLKATYNDVGADSPNVKKIKNLPTSYGGIYKRGSSPTYLNFNNGNDGNWWGAFGAMRSYDIGIPAINEGISGLQILYLKNKSNSKVQEYKNGVCYANEFIEK